MTSLTTCLWFDFGKAEQAAEFYTTVFDDCEIQGIDRYPEDSPGPAGQVMTARFRIGTQEFVGLNGGPNYTFSEAISFQIPCADQAEIDRYWDALTADGGQEGPCGWLKDRFGVSWQVVPVQLPQLLNQPDAERAQAAFGAMMKQTRPVIAEIQDAVAAVTTG
ncbi:MAG: VOC family protein [Kineosporiaceae bacterium]